MKQKQIRQIIPINGYCLLANTEESQEIIDGGSLTTSQSFLTKSPIATLRFLDANSDLEVKPGDSVLYRNTSPIGAVALYNDSGEYKTLQITHSSNLIAIVK